MGFFRRMIEFFNYAKNDNNKVIKSDNKIGDKIIQSINVSNKTTISSESYQKTNAKEVNDFCHMDNYKNFNNKYIISDVISKGLEEVFFAIDLETTGLDYEDDRIVEISIVKFVKNKVVDEFNTLVNPKMAMPAKASSINHITDSMLIDAPTERKALQEMLCFLNKQATKEIIFCAHNAKFDINFLTNALVRQKFSLKFSYIDTCKEARKIIKGLRNYKLGTVANTFGIINNKAHRANGDAKVCGFIFIKLIKLYLDNQAEMREKNTPNNEEQVICAWIISILRKTKNNLGLLRFYKNSNKFVQVKYFFTFLEFKINKKGKYIILPQIIARTSGLPTEYTTLREGGGDYLRAYFNNFNDLTRISDYITRSYDNCYKEFLSYIKLVNDSLYLETAKYEYCNSGLSINNETANRLLAESNTLVSIFELNIELDKKFDFNISKLNIHPIYYRAPISKPNINLNVGNENYSLYCEGERFRKNEEIDKAIPLFDQVRSTGCCFIELYESYAKAFHSLEAYDDEIDILNEGVERLKKLQQSTGILETRRNRAIVKWMAKN